MPSEDFSSRFSSAGLKTAGTRLISIQQFTDSSSNAVRDGIRDLASGKSANINRYSVPCGEPICQSIGVDSYPKDLEEIKRRIRKVEAFRDQLVATMTDQGFDLAPEHSLVPIYIHRYVVCTSNPSCSVVLSIDDGTDAIVYGNSLREYLEKEFVTSPILTTDGNARPAAPSAP